MRKGSALKTRTIYTKPPTNHNDVLVARAKAAADALANMVYFNSDYNSDRVDRITAIGKVINDSQ